MIIISFIIIHCVNNLKTDVFIRNCRLSCGAVSLNGEHGSDSKHTTKTRRCLRKRCPLIGCQVSHQKAELQVC